MSYFLIARPPMQGIGAWQTLGCSIPEWDISTRDKNVPSIVPNTNQTPYQDWVTAVRHQVRIHPGTRML
jgi:hypothetical protein